MVRQIVLYYLRKCVTYTLSTVIILLFINPSQEYLNILVLRSYFLCYCNCYCFPLNWDEVENCLKIRLVQ